MLNSFYGKFCEKSEVCGKIVVKKNGVVGFVKGELQRKKNKKYLPVAIWTTAYSRYDLIDKIIKAGGDSPTSSFLYCDTDSLHCLDRRVLPFIDIDRYKNAGGKSLPRENSQVRITRIRFPYLQPG